MPNQKTYSVKGMHCGSCETLIEKCLVKIPSVRSANASTKKGQVTIEYQGLAPSTNSLGQAVADYGYTVFDNEPVTTTNEHQKPGLVKTLLVAGLAIISFWLLYKTGLSSIVAKNDNSALPAFFIFGLIAGFSSCAALVGGIILSMSKQWTSLYAPEDATRKKLRPYWLFNFGRLASYAVFGALLGLIGSAFRPSLTLTSLLTIVVSIFMIVMALQMLGIRSLRSFQLRLPKSLTGRLADETKFRGRFMPLVMGGLTFFLPCGFTLTAQSLAILSGSAFRGSIIMFLFALGTLPALMAISFSSVAFMAKRKSAGLFLKVAGVLVLFFALLNLNGQFNLLGWPSLNNLTWKSETPTEKTDTQSTSALPPLVNGKQIVSMKASAYEYSPSHLIARANTPVRWEITDIGTSGCTSAIIARNLFKGSIRLTPGETSFIEFTPPGPGQYKFSCSMGMVNGVFEFVE